MNDIDKCQNNEILHRILLKLNLEEKILALINDELKIVSISCLLLDNLIIPEYQRPYRWQVRATNTLFNDTYKAFIDGIGEYRLGTVILHKDEEEYNIVDGQQRITTLSILLYVLGEDSSTLFNNKYAPSSQKAVIDNFTFLKRRVQELSEVEKKRFKEYLKTKCTVVKIVTDSEQEAFQFFDSQNFRGKALKPHDLLKAYHLREMAEETDKVKLELISQWEDMEQNALEDLFESYLYPVTRWIKNKDGLNYSADKIQHFKGIKHSSTYNYALYNKASNIFIEQVNSSGANELIGLGELNQFQLTQSIIAGKRFFSWTLHYAKLLDKVKNKIATTHGINEVPMKETGDIYTKQLYEAALMLFADRFNFEEIDESIMRQIYKWCYSLRLEMKKVGLQTINNYAQGRHERKNLNLDLMNKISEMTNSQELKEILLDEPTEATKYGAVYKAIKEGIGIEHEG